MLAVHVLQLRSGVGGQAEVGCLNLLDSYSVVCQPLRTNA